MTFIVLPVYLIIILLSFFFELDIDLKDEPLSFILLYQPTDFKLPSCHKRYKDYKVWLALFIIMILRI